MTTGASLFTAVTNCCSAAETGSSSSITIEPASSVAAFTSVTAGASLFTAVTNCCSAAETGSSSSTTIEPASSMRLWDSIRSTTGSFDEG